MVHSLNVIAERVVRDGKVAVLVSPGFGAGWYTWHGLLELVFDPIVVEMVESGRHSEIESYIDNKYPEDTPYIGGASDLEVMWVPVGAQFRIDEYDGSESLVLASEEKWLTA